MISSGFFVVLLIEKIICELANNLFFDKKIRKTSRRKQFLLSDTKGSKNGPQDILININLPGDAAQVKEGVFKVNGK